MTAHYIAVIVEVVSLNEFVRENDQLFNSHHIFMN